MSQALTTVVKQLTTWGAHEYRLPVVNVVQPFAVYHKVFERLPAQGAERIPLPSFFAGELIERSAQPCTPRYVVAAKLEQPDSRS